MPAVMRAAVVEERGGPFQVRTVDVPAPQPDEVLVRIVATGVCQTDAHMRTQDYPIPLPMILGHEGAGVVEYVGSAVTSVAAGDHVALTVPSCGRCDACWTGAPVNCAQFIPLAFSGSRLDGSNAYAGAGVHGHFFGQSSFAQFALASERNTVRIAKDMPLELAGPLGCGLQTGAGAVLNSLRVNAGESLAVFGTGAVGLAAVMAANIVGAGTVVAVDVSAARLAVATELGATDTVNAATTDPAEHLRKIRPSGFDYVLETTARPEMLSLAVELITPRGVAALVGAPPVGTAASIDMTSLLAGRTLRGIMQGDSVPHVFIPKLVELYQSGRFPIDRLIRSYELADVNQAFADAANGKVVKPVLLMGD